MQGIVASGVSSSHTVTALRYLTHLISKFGSDSRASRAWQGAGGKAAGNWQRVKRGGKNCEVGTELVRVEYYFVRGYPVTRNRKG